MKSVTLASVVAALLFVASISALQVTDYNPKATATVTVGSETFTFTGGGCANIAIVWTMVVGSATKKERFEINIPGNERAPNAVKPTKDGTYTNATVHVIPAGRAAGGETFHAGGRTSKGGDLTITLKNNLRSGEFSGTTDGSPSLPIKGTFTC